MPHWSCCVFATARHRAANIGSECLSCGRIYTISRYESLTFSSGCHLELPTRRAALCSSSVLIIMQIFDYLLRKITASSFQKCSVFISSTHIKGRLKLSMWSVNHPVLLTVCSGCVSELMMGLGCVFVMRLRLALSCRQCCCAPGHQCLGLLINIISQH